MSTTPVHTGILCTSAHFAGLFTVNLENKP
jgi:hypothetical protein